MAISDLESLIRLLDEHPEWTEALQERLVNEKVLLRLLEQRAELREAARRLILGDELLQLPALMRELAEISRQNTEQIRQNTELLRQQDARIARLEALTEELAEISRQNSEQIRQNSEQIRQNTEQIRQNTELLRQQDARIARLEALTEELAEISRQNTEQIRQNTEQLRQHAVLLQHIVEVQEQLLRDSHDLKEWRRGEEGRRAGERFEVQTIKRAPRLMNGGEGGTTDQPHVRQRLTQWLHALWQQEPDLYPEGEDDPTLADLIWWKGNQVAVVEISLKVNGRDVLRACQRANVLRRAGVNAVPMVIGEEWATPDSKLLAEQNAVEWMLKGDISPGFIAFRRLSDGATAQV